METLGVSGPRGPRAFALDASPRPTDAQELLDTTLNKIRHSDADFFKHRVKHDYNREALTRELKYGEGQGLLLVGVCAAESLPFLDNDRAALVLLHEAHIDWLKRASPRALNAFRPRIDALYAVLFELSRDLEVLKRMHADGNEPAMQDLLLRVARTPYGTRISSQDYLTTTFRQGFAHAAGRALNNEVSAMCQGPLALLLDEGDYPRITSLNRLRDEQRRFREDAWSNGQPTSAELAGVFQAAPEAWEWLTEGGMKKLSAVLPLAPDYIKDVMAEVANTIVDWEAKDPSGVTYGTWLRSIAKGELPEGLEAYAAWAKHPGWPGRWKRMVAESIRFGDTRTIEEQLLPRIRTEGPKAYRDFIAQAQHSPFKHLPACCSPRSSSGRSPRSFVMAAG
jgi:hypothetical protein